MTPECSSAAALTGLVPEPKPKSRSGRTFEFNIERVLAGLGRKKRLHPRELLFLEGDAATALYVVLEGRVESVHLSEDGRKFVSFEAGPGDALGEAVLIEGGCYASCAEAIAPTVVVGLGREPAMRLVREAGDFAAAIALAFSRRLYQTEARSRLIALNGVDGRIAGVLVDMAVKGSLVAGLTHREIAERTGSSRESVTLGLNKLKRLGILKLSRGTIEIQSLARLAALSSVGPAAL